MEPIRLAVDVLIGFVTSLLCRTANSRLTNDSRQQLEGVEELVYPVLRFGEIAR